MAAEFVAMNMCIISETRVLRIHDSKFKMSIFCGSFKFQRRRDFLEDHGRSTRIQ